MQSIIDGAQLFTRDSVHTLLAQQLSLPAWYGKNLDALFDCLTDLQESTQITLLHPQALEAHLGAYAQALWHVLRLAAQENSAITFSVIP